MKAIWSVKQPDNTSNFTPEYISEDFRSLNLMTLRLQEGQDLRACPSYFNPH